jgi:hypothetical protein
LNLEVIPGYKPELEEPIRTLLENDRDPYDIMNDISDLLGLYGVEGVSVPDDGSYPPLFHIYYINTGETYETTLCYDQHQGFMVTSWGNWFEEKEEYLT